MMFSKFDALKAFVRIVALVFVTSVVLAGCQKVRIDIETNALKKGTEAERVAAAKALGEIGGRGAVEPLIMALEDEDLYLEKVVRVTIIQSLGQIGDTLAIKSLIPLLKRSGKSDGWIERVAAIQALAEIGGPRTFDPLIRVVKFRFNVPMIGSITFVEDWIVKRVAAKALAVQDDFKIELLFDAFQDEKPSGLQMFSQSKYRALIKGEDDIRHLATYICREMGTPVIVSLVEKLEQGDRTAKRAAVLALSLIGDAQAVAPFDSTLTYENLQARWAAEKYPKAIYETIKSVIDEDPTTRIPEQITMAIEPLKSALDDEDDYLRFIAKIGLKKLGVTM